MTRISQDKIVITVKMTMFVKKTQFISAKFHVWLMSEQKKFRSIKMAGNQKFELKVFSYITTRHKNIIQYNLCKRSQKTNNIHYVQVEPLFSFFVSLHKRAYKKYKHKQ